MPKCNITSVVILSMYFYCVCLKIMVTCGSIKIVLLALYQRRRGRRKDVFPDSFLTPRVSNTLPVYIFYNAQRDKGERRSPRYP